MGNAISGLPADHGKPETDCQCSAPDWPGRPLLQQADEQAPMNKPGKECARRNRAGPDVAEEIRPAKAAHRSLPELQQKARALLPAQADPPATSPAARQLRFPEREPILS